MALIWDSPGQDFSANSALGDCTTPSFTYPITSTPLILPRDWSDNYYLTDDFNDYEFQSNRLDPGPSTSSTLSSLTGLGISNLEAAKDKQNPSSTTGGLGDRRSALRTPRTDSVYNSFPSLYGEIDLDYPPSDVGIGLESSWSFSSILKATDLATSSGTASSFSSSQNLNGDASASTSSTGDDLDWSFERLSEATGLSIAEIAAQVSLTAEAALRGLSDENSTSFPATQPDTLDPFSRLGTMASWPAMLPQTSQPLLVLTDPTTRTFPWHKLSEGVNPADILPPLPPSSPPASLPGPAQRSFLYQPSDTSVSCRSSDSDLLDNSAAISEGKALDNASTDVGGPWLYLPPPPIPECCPQTHVVSEDERSVFQSPSSSEYSPSLPLVPQKRTVSSRIGTRRISRIKVAKKDPDFMPSPQDYYHNDHDQHILGDLDLGTPVLDAHRGIDIEVLKAKAERYRLRNQGRDYDKRWLISFAGKLSARGELIEEFRCYVSGCKQVNKRRDHILIHVGAHLDQRPFKCEHCPARFLRKNECKRHELSHTGDLLKRHMKRTHRMDLKAEKENADNDTYRPKKRARY
ncbi:unnamed protein product [Cyclocybe aegerita]|uniref:C2H2-type domain-containing protein n=1 Tax=Cyclocybe aegerita TaxID=1973307 RepID=A0A8S0W2V6_CYCAE|nr:unnamed protein product [Cyclocybe aegerita]